MTHRARNLAALALAGLFLPAAAALGQAETFTATASAKTKTGTKTAPVKATVDKISSDEERGAAAAALKTGGTHALQAALAKASQCGTLTVGDKQVAIKYCATRSTGSGRILTLVSDQPVAHIGSELPDAKPKKGYDVAVALLILDAGNTGHGELDLAAKVKMTGSGAIQIEGYSGLKIWLKDIAKAKS